MKSQKVLPTDTRYYRDDDFYVARSEDDRRTVLEKSKEVLQAYPLVRVCAALFVLALVFRVAYNLNLGNYAISPELGDAHDYDQVARSLLDGAGYSKPWAFTDDRGETVVEIRPTMFRPPLYTVAVAMAYGLANRNPLMSRILLSSIGATTVVAIFLVTRKLFNSRVAAVAGILASVYPPLIAADGVLYPEALFTFLALALVYSLLLLREKPLFYRAVVVGVLLGSLALTRAEGAAWILLPALFLGVSVPNVSLRKKGILFGCVVCTALLVYAPWLHHTWSNFKTIAPSTSLGNMMAGANNRVTYYDRIYTGSWYYGALTPDRATLFEVRDPRHTEKTVDDLFLAKGLEYMRTHLERLPTVVGARILRGFDLWDPYVTARLEEGWGRPPWITYAGMAFYFPVLLAASYAAWRSRRRWKEFLPIYTIPVGFLIFSAFAFGSSRFRLTADASMIILSSSVFYGLSRTAVVTRRASLTELLDAIDPSTEESTKTQNIPEEVLRAMKMRARRELLSRGVASEVLASMHEGADILAVLDSTDQQKEAEASDAYLHLDRQERADSGTEAEPTISSSQIQLTNRSRLDPKTGVITVDHFDSTEGS